MILILSKSSKELTTERVIDHLRSSNVSYIRFNGDDFVNNSYKITFKITSNKRWEFELETEDLKVDSSEISSVWFRRRFNHNVKQRFEEYYPHCSSDLADYHIKELKEIYSALELSLSNAFWLNKPSKSRIGKLICLAKAKECGMQIPSSFITNNKKDLLKEALRFDKFITKPMRDITVIRKGNEGFNLYTKYLTTRDSFISNLKEYIFPSFVQEAITKMYEVRVIYLNGDFFCAGHMSQSLSETSDDYRVYQNQDQRMRVIPVSIPYQLKEKISKFMRMVDVNFGSLDFIKTEEDYIFLELNSVGQYLGISESCGFNLSERIARLLIEKSN